MSTKKTEANTVIAPPPAPTADATATADPTPAPAAPDASYDAPSAGIVPKYRVKDTITRPVLRFGVSEEFVLIEGAMYKGEVIEQSKIKTVPTLLPVVNLKTGESMLMVCATVFIKEMEAKYPNAEYVGKSFKLRKIKKADYSLWAIAEIELE